VNARDASAWLPTATPNDLFEWREDNKTVVHDAHVLRSLKREAPTRSVADITRDIPADKLEKLGEMLSELAKNEERVD